ncbi:WD40-repeat-containing domain protein [Radiomyces spectabilis]|uniref:WD40-repeat-containing domain protein n=1 Tax=Radiomyces spectabilis TaxID=64574 RepID=UPI00221F309B|nr:WD40-repeat-containing domain protein [Radiomyces spectabilis]KAI8369385.1 WD40-repeat-containing domain protein [Radiomyces spectabilis]
MSVYNHRPMVPAPMNRIAEILDNIRAEFDQLAQEAYVCKTQRDDFELKMNSQIQEMNNFQQSLMELERSQQTLKKQYEDEIGRLRQQLDQAQARSGHTTIPTSMPMSSGMHSSQHSAPPPPNIGPASNYFGGIMNAHTNSQAPGLVAPPQMGDPNQPSSQPPHISYPTSQPPSSVPGPYMNGAPAPAPPMGHGYAYPPRMVTPGTPKSQAADPQANANKRKSGPPAGYSPGPIIAGRPTPPPAKGPASAMTPGGLADVDPETVPANMKIEGQDWFALFNPKVTRYLKVDLVHTLEHNSVVCCVKFSQDGRYLAAGCNRSTFIYDAMTSQRICVLQDDSVPKDGDLYIRSVCFSPDGQYLATGAEDKQIRIWDIAKKRIRNVLSGHEQDIYSLDFSRDGRIIVSGSGDRTARIWSMVDGQCLHVLRIKDLDQKDPGVTSVAISPDGHLVAAGSLDKMVRVWDTRTGNLLERLEGHKDSVYSVTFMPDGKTLVSGSLDKTLKLWQLGTNEGRGYGADRDRSKGPCKMTFTGHKDFVLSVACTPDGNWVVSGSKDRGVQFWDPRTGQTQFILQGHKNSVISVAISPSGRPLFATGSGDNRARIWSYEPLVS